MEPGNVLRIMMKKASEAASALDLSGATINNSGSWNQGAATSTLFDSTQHAAVGSSARSGNSGSTEMHLLLATAADITELRLYGPSNGGMHETDTDQDYTIYKDASTFGTGGTLVGSLTAQNNSGNNEVVTLSSLGNGSKVTRYTILWEGSTTNEKFACSEIEADGII